MCLIFIKPKTAKNYLTYERFSNALENNPHAVGIVYRDSDGINIERFVKPETYKEEIWNIIKDKEEFAIHFRYATHGILNLTNTHPFIVTKGLCMMHNGVMNEFGDLNKDWSDTKNFVEYFLKPYVEQEGIGVIKDESFKTDLEKIIGGGNKLLFIDKDFNFTIVNEKAGAWKDGCWLSNTYSTEPSYSKYYTKYAPTDGTAKNDSKSYDDYYDYGNYYSHYNNYTFNDMNEVYQYISDEIASGYDSGDLVPYEMIYDKDVTWDDMEDISLKVSNGVLNGFTKNGTQWECLIDMDKIKDMISPIDEDSKLK